MSSTKDNVDYIEIRVPGKPEHVRTVRRTIAEFAQSHNLPKSLVEAIEIATSEAVSNVVRHAYNGHSSEKPVMVKCARRQNEITLEISDKGCGFCPPPDEAIPNIDLNRDGGLGIVLIKTLMDKVNYCSRPNSGTKIRMVVQL